MRRLAHSDVVLFVGAVPGAGSGTHWNVPFFYPQTIGNQMETKAPYFASSSEHHPDDAMKAVFSLLCAMSRFYASNRHLLVRDTPRLLLLNRIASGVELELASSGILESYAADLIHIDEMLNIGIRSRIPGKNLVAVNFTPVRPKLEPLRKICGVGTALYQVGIGIGLCRKRYRAAWHAPEEQTRLRMERSFRQWTAEAPFLDRLPFSDSGHEP